MRPSASLGDVSIGVVPSFSVLNAQISAVRQQCRILQVENSAITESTQALRIKNDHLVVENDTLRTQNQALLDHNTRLEQDNSKLMENLRLERSKATVRLRKAPEDKNKISRLQDALRQRDFFIRAMIEIKLHHPVLKDAYASIEKGHNADDAIIKAIQMAADQPGSPWCKITAQPDVTKSDLYLSAIEFAATARIRLQEYMKLTRFWKYMAKSVPQNTGLLTPSPSALLGIDKVLEQQEHSTALDDLLNRLRAGENADPRKEKKPVLIKPGNLESVPPSPTLAYLQFHRTAIRRHEHGYRDRERCETTRPVSNGPVSQDSISSLASCASNILSNQAEVQRALGSLDSCAKQRTDLSTLDHSNGFASPCMPATSLERICAAFATPDSEGALEELLYSQDPLIHSIPSLCALLPSQTPAAGRGRSATVPFSARDLIFLPVKTVTSKQAILAPRGDKEKKAQAMLAHRARFNEGASLVRSKALMLRKSSGPLKPSTSLFSPKAQLVGPTNTRPAVSTPPSSRITDSSKATKDFLPTPPPDSDFFKQLESHIRAPTVTRNKTPDQPRTETSSPTPALLPAIRPLEPPSLVLKANPYVVNDLDCKIGTTISGSSFTSCTSVSGAGFRVSTMSQEDLVKDVKRKLNFSVDPLRAAKCEKGNIPPQPSPTASRGPSRNLHQTASRLSTSADSTTWTSSARLSRRSSSVARPVPKPTPPLKITKKHPAKKQVLAPTASMARLVIPFPPEQTRLRSSSLATAGSLSVRRGNEPTHCRAPP